MGLALCKEMVSKEEERGCVGAHVRLVEDGHREKKRHLKLERSLKPV
jgi:hypothetical protein